MGGLKIERRELNDKEVFTDVPTFHSKDSLNLTYSSKKFFRRCKSLSERKKDWKLDWLTKIGHETLTYFILVLGVRLRKFLPFRRIHWAPFFWREYFRWKGDFGPQKGVLFFPFCHLLSPPLLDFCLLHPFFLLSGPLILRLFPLHFSPLLPIWVEHLATRLVLDLLSLPVRLKGISQQITPNRLGLHYQR